MATSSSKPLLGPYRVLDLTDERGLVCGEILGDLGADVIAIEPLGGNTARRFAPFADDRDDDPEASLWWASYARNKRSVVIDIATAGGQEQLKKLVTGADFLIESFDPGHLDGLGLGYDALSAVNPALVYVSITAFGQTGPKAHYAMTDMAVMAASGPQSLWGDDDRAPLRVGVPQAFLHGGLEAVAGALIAHRERVVSGLGQHVDVSTQQAVAQATQAYILASAVGETPAQRVKGGLSVSGIPLPFVWPVKDGFAALTFFFGSAIGPFSKRFMQWMYEEGACDEATRDKDWIGYAVLLLNGQEPMSEHQRVLGLIGDFLRSKTKAELLEQGMKRRLLLVPISTIANLHDSPQFEARNYWRELDTPSLGRPVRVMGPFAKFSATPLEHWFGSPRIGQHTDEVLGEPRTPAAFSGTGKGSRKERRLPLEGLKVLDFMWAVAGPATTRVLADYGATVVKAESTISVDTGRTFQPFMNGEAGAETSILFHDFNAGKLGLTLNLGTDEGKEVAKDLVKWADVVCESFSPRAMRGWGLGYEALRELKPDIIMLSSCLFGQSGPYSEIAGFGPTGAAVGGFNSLTGWPGRDPAMVAAYTDYMAPRYAISALMAALDHRDRTGEGQYIDLSQAEAGLNFLAPAWLDFVVNGREFERRGNADLQMSPHAVFPAAGDDKWVVIACRDDDDWTGLLEVSGLGALASDGRFNTIEGRLANREALEDAVSEWTRGLPPLEIERLLQQRGVPAHQMQNSPEAVQDPQFAHRKHFVEVPHAMIGPIVIEGTRFKLSETPASIERPGPFFGEHNDYVLREILGYDDDKIADLVIAEVLM